MITDIFFLNELGRRENLEDHIFPEPGVATIEDNVFIVCDGVGGSSKGEEASRIACETISSFLSAVDRNQINQVQIEAAVHNTIAAMFDYQVVHPEAQQMSTTLTLACLSDHGVWTAWCGDSRIYHIRDGRVMWQSKDHSLVQQLLQVGEITPKEATHHPQKNVILRSLNAGHGNSKIDLQFLSDIKPDDYLLLCTDGILENINETELMKILGSQQRDRNKQQLFLEYCEGNTNDNYSMYLLQMGENESVSAGFWEIKHFLYLILAGLLVFAAVKYFGTDKAITSANVDKSVKHLMAPKSSAKNVDSGMIKMLEQKIKKDNSPNKNK